MFYHVIQQLIYLRHVQKYKAFIQNLKCKIILCFFFALHHENVLIKFVAFIMSQNMLLLILSSKHNLCYMFNWDFDKKTI